MKQKLFVTLLLILLSWQVSAQRISLIPSVGYNYSSITSVEKSAPRDGINVGLGAEVAFTKRLCLETGAYYSMQGASFPIINRLTENYSLEVINNYINVPLLFKGYIIKGLHLGIGPQVGFLINSKEEFSIPEIKKNRSDNTTEMIDETIRNWISGETNKFTPIDFSAVISLGYQFSFGLDLTTKLNLGMSNILKKSDNELYNLLFPKRTVMHNNVLQFNIGWKF